MTGFEILQVAATGYAVFWAFYLLLLPLATSLRKCAPTPEKKIADRWPQIAVIVPAANAERVITRCVEALRAAEYPAAMLRIYVVADHCTDNTAELAHRAGASILARNEGPRGKTYTLGWVFNNTDSLGITADLYLVVDATALVGANFIRAMAEHWLLGDDIISNYTIVSQDNRAWHARCLALMFVHRNFQNLSRQRLGLSAMLGGCGMGFSRRYIARFGWSLALPKLQNSHPTEDWRHAVRAVEEGYRVAFAQDARVATSLRGSLTQATQQGTRWERGRLINAATYAVRLLLRGLWKRDAIKIFAALDAMQPPVAILAALSAGLATLTWFRGAESKLFTAWALAPFILVAIYGTIVTVRGRREGIGVATAIWGPIYLAWRCAAFLLAWGFLDRIKLSRAGKPLPDGVVEPLRPQPPAG